MDLIDFTFLSLQFSKNNQHLAQLGWGVDLDASDNMFRDSLILTRMVGLQKYFFVIEHRTWDRYREFCLFSSASTRYYYRFNPTNGQPVPVKKGNTGLFWSLTEMPDDLKWYGDQVIQVLTELATKAMNDKFVADSQEVA